MTGDGGWARLFQLVSPALPIGGYTYSRGLEQAVEAGWVRDEAGAHAWIGGLLGHAMARLDGPLLLRLHRSFTRGDGSATRWAWLADATRETAELQAESRATGRALVRLLGDLDLIDRASLEEGVGRCHLAAFALAARGLGLDASAGLRAYLWTWLEGSVAAAVKLVPLGQTAGQRILLDLGGALEAAACHAEGVDDESIGAFTPGQALASARHETQHTRLFRS